MPDDENNNNSLIPIHNTGLIKVGNIIKITDKVLKEYSERTLAVYYKSVIIGDQEWMIENLRVTIYDPSDSELAKHFRFKKSQIYPFHYQKQYVRL